MKKVVPNILNTSDQANIQSYMSGATARPPRRRMKEKEKRIQTPFDRFNTGGIHVSAIKHLTGLYLTFVTSQ